MHIFIDTWANTDCTIGRLTCEELHCVTLELPWENNENDISCIHAGTYEAVLYQSPSKGLVLLLKDVPGRDWVEIHAGNFTYQILGCILVGDGLKYLDSDTILDVTNSKNTLEKLLGKLKGADTIRVTISRVGHYP